MGRATRSEVPATQEDVLGVCKLSEWKTIAQIVHDLQEARKAATTSQALAFVKALKAAKLVEFQAVPRSKSRFEFELRKTKAGVRADVERDLANLRAPAA